MLWQEAKAGNEAAFLELFHQYRPVIYRVQGIYSLQDFDQEDWLQVGRIVLQESIEKFQELRGATFGVFFRRNFENRIKSYLRYQHALKRRSNLNAVSLEEKIAYDGPDFLNDGMNVADNLNIKLMVEEAMDQEFVLFSQLEREVLTAYFQGKDFNEIAAENELSLNKVRCAYDRSKAKLLKYIHEWN
ncbi:MULTISPECIES: sigma-70 family RNA polymerase sigma factor [Enterococcus]|uniref:sigma-70 family RNA polymerase sigma factor n=1 Tax=Enterococcus TaxID=1350 RepID=UPI0010F6B4A2|nr:MULTISPECIES: sigma-70 family RNA polymerase sigma factor [Enterococcus]KAF1302607.1 hypothetical protein BAU16_06075 [Enterococcus sp. JM9B]